MVYIKEAGVTVEDSPSPGSSNIMLRPYCYVSPVEAEILLRGLLRWKLETTRGNPELCAALDDALEAMEKGR